MEPASTSYNGTRKHINIVREGPDVSVYYQTHRVIHVSSTCVTLDHGGCVTGGTRDAINAFFNKYPQHSTSTTLHVNEDWQLVLNSSKPAYFVRGMKLSLEKEELRHIRGNILSKVPEMNSYKCQRAPSGQRVCADKLGNLSIFLKNKLNIISMSADVIVLDKCNSNTIETVDAMNHVLDLVHLKVNFI
jgi:hypothetical protein